MVNSIKEVVENDLCISCGACTFSCDKSDVKMQESKNKGVYLPRVSEELEDSFDICPGKGYEIEGIAKSIFPEAKHNDIDLGRWSGAYSVHSNLEKITKNAASGGIMVGIAQYLLEEKVVSGVLTTKFKYGPNGPRPESFIATNVDELIESQGSKYCPVPVFEGLDAINEFEGSLVFIGTPCQIAALKMLQTKHDFLNKKIILTSVIFMTLVIFLCL